MFHGFVTDVEWSFERCYNGYVCLPNQYVSSMTDEQISRIIDRVARQFDRQGVVYTHDQLSACIAAYARLLDETGTSDYGKELAASIFARIMELAVGVDNPWDWVATELRFEAQAEAMGDRVQAATNYLRYLTAISDHDLDRYNDRISRFNKATEYN